MDPTLLSDLIGRHPNVTFILLHAGHDFLPTDNPNYYNGTLVDAAIEVAQSHPNVYLEISAMHAQHPNGTLKYLGGNQALEKMVDVGLTDRVIWGSDANHQQGTLLPVVATSLQAMIDAGFTEEERCMALSGTARNIFDLSGGNVSTQSLTSGASWLPANLLVSMVNIILLPMVVAAMSIF